MNILVLSCAEAELVEAVLYYYDQSPGLGYEFAAEVQRTFERIRHHPTAWPLFSSRCRRCLTDRFPFGVLYQVRGDCILVGATCTSNGTRNGGRIAKEMPSANERQVG